MEVLMFTFDLLEGKIEINLEKKVAYFFGHDYESPLEVIGIDKKGKTYIVEFKNFWGIEYRFELDPPTLYKKHWQKIGQK